MTNQDPKIEQLNDMRLRSMAGGGPARVEKQHQSGKLTARERLDLLLDPGSFRGVAAFVVHRERNLGMGKPENQYPGDSVVTGRGAIDARPGYGYSPGCSV